MTRFHVIAILAALLGAVALALSNATAAIGLLILAMVIAGFGVALPQLRLFGPFVCRGDVSRRRVALTFDDGPDNQSTPELLDLLRAERVPATFFCIGRNVTAQPELTARIVREGHLLANHTYSHSNATNFFGVEKLVEEMTHTQSAIRDAAGVTPAFFRPPMGLSNPRVFKAATVVGLRVIGWTARGFDTQCSTPHRIVRRILRGVEPGAIILLHDGKIPADRLLATVKLLLAKLRERGYECVRLDTILT
jgi:peptidoglycan/xylan/chitin deacetylase (PgdA/CDA1 family)